MPDQISIRLTDHNNARYEIPKYSEYFGSTKNTKFLLNLFYNIL